MKIMIVVFLSMLNSFTYANIFPYPSPYTGTTIHDFEEITPIVPMVVNTPDKETTASLLDQQLQKYLVSASANEVSNIEKLSNKYWEYALLSDAIYDKDNYSLAYKHKEVAKSGWKLYSYYPNFASGLVVGLYKKDGKYILAIGGTKANPKLDING